MHFPVIKRIEYEKMAKNGQFLTFISLILCLKCHLMTALMDIRKLFGKLNNKYSIKIGYFLFEIQIMTLNHYRIIREKYVH